MKNAARRLGLAVAVIGLLAGVAGQAEAGIVLTYVGKWEVDDGPHYSTNPPVYSGQEAAALLFGGVASDYAISTLGTDPLAVDHQSWYSIWGVGGGTKGAETLHIDLGNPGYGDPGGTNTAWSAYVRDNAIGSLYTNYAFKVTNDVAAVPEPSSIALVCTALPMGLGLAWKRRRKTVSAAAI